MTLRETITGAEAHGTVAAAVASVTVGGKKTLTSGADMLL